MPFHQESTHLFSRSAGLLLCSSAVQQFRERHLTDHRCLNALFRGRHFFTNREGHADFNFTLFTHNGFSGTSALVRVKNESSKIIYSLRSILNVFDEIILIDNDSHDGTLAKVRRFKEIEDRHNIIKIYSYLYPLARFGPEHSRTPEDSVHSAVYFSNWGLSHCSFKYVCKWDGDMVLRRELHSPFRTFLQEIQSGRLACWTLVGQTIYRDMAGDYFLSVGEVNSEVEVVPYGLNQRFTKNRHWECLSNRSKLPVRDFGPVAFYELKFADEDEFSHWSTEEWPSLRKQREWNNFQLIRQARIDPERFQKLPRRFFDLGAAPETLISSGPA